MIEADELSLLRRKLALALERIDGLEARIGAHLGPDGSSSGWNYPHPSTVVAEFDTSQSSGAFVRRTTNADSSVGDRYETTAGTSIEIIDVQETAVRGDRYAFLRGYSNAASGTALTLGSNEQLLASPSTIKNYIAMVTGTTSSDITLDCEYGTGISQNIVKLVLNALANTIAFTGPKVGMDSLALNGVTSDPAVYLADGDAWYRSDIDKFRGQVNGSTVNFLTSADVPSKDYIDLRLLTVNGAAPAWATDAHGSLTGLGGHLDFTDGTDYTLVFETATVPPTYSASMALEVVMSGPTGGGNFVFDCDIGEHADGAGGSTDIMSLVDQVKANHASANTIKVQSFNVENAPTVSATARQLQVTVTWNGAHASNTENAHFWLARLAFTRSL